MKDQSHLKRTMTLTLLLFFVSFGIYGFASSQTVPTDVTRAAQKGLSTFIETQAMPDDVGLRAEKAAGALTLTHGFQMHTVDPPRLAECDSIHASTEPTGLWRFVVCNEGNPISMVTVATVNGQWTAVSMGGAQLAGEFSKVIERWPAKNGYSYRFIRIFQAKSDFVEISLNGNPLGLVPLTAARMALGIQGPFAPGMLLHSSEMMQDLKDIISTELRKSGEFGKNLF